ncbi:DUF748 domain-containing protein [Costertonia aggregata]|uniref:DUF748 domain-containing protein n=1 Tax=Costertonia aggregata TaxID=343403 RepID=A0A7H9ANN6_9FLAO|nr:DUF748 domain-containing protein [Costertonia aggregata]QLG44993.1 DUF748 domain-containing protein [Costertonia aggregata]
MRIPPKNINKAHNIKSKLPRIMFGVVVVLGLSIWAVHVYAKHKLSQLVLERLPNSVELAYSAIDLNLFSGNVVLHEVNVGFLKNDNFKTKGTLDLDKFTIQGLDYRKLLSENTFKANRVCIERGDLEIYDQNSSDIKLAMSDIALELRSFMADSSTLQQKIPFTYKTVDLSLGKLHVAISPFEVLSIDSLFLRNGDLRTTSISIMSKYGKSQLSKKIQYERDHIQLTIPNSSGKNMGMTLVNDSLKFSADNVTFLNPRLALYRDKLVTDNTVKKPLYDTMLNQLPIKLDIKTVVLEDGQVSYAEKTDKAVEPVSISFKSLDATINNLSNTNTQRTEVNARAALMGKAPITLDFSFQVKNQNDTFLASSTLKNLEGSLINPFLESNANVRAQGLIKEMYFTISGNGHKSTGDMKMKYQNFKFTVLDKDRLGINKTLTAIVNLFTNDGSKTDSDGYRYGKIEVERVPTKSFFNYLWLNTKDGLKNTVLGNGKKED